MARQKTKFGRMKCPDCGAPVVVKINPQETLSYSCDECDGSAYSKKWEGRYAAWLAKIERTAPAPAPAAKPAAKGEPAKAPAKSDNFFEA